MDADKEITLEEAQEIKKSYKLGDTVSEEIKSKDFGRIAAQTAKQVLTQKLRDIER
ncbi:MAG: transcription termination/antitermination protein NusA, partial [Clostridia bacterium]|nr:transcription termination/antitermination protein NusA [Clostridia bacterium]